MMESPSSLALAIAAAAAVIAGVIDFRTLRVPNKLTVPLLLAGLVFHTVVSGWAGFQSSLFGAVCGFALLLLFFVMGVMGAGDVKLMAAIGAWLGLSGALTVFVLAAAINCVYSMIVLLVQGGPRRVAIAFQIIYLQMMTLGRYVGEDERIEVVTKQKEQRSRLVPFAAMIALGVTLFVLGQMSSSNFLVIQ